MPLIPLAPGTILVAYVDGQRRIPDVEVLMKSVRRHVAARVTAPLADVVQRVLDRPGLLRMQLTPRDRLPAAPPVEFLRAVRTGDEELRRLAAATHGIVVSCGLPPMGGLPGFTTALVAARCTALALGGVILEVASSRLLPVESHDATIDGSGVVAVGGGLLVDVDDRSAITTSGLGRYGLPELSLDGVPGGAERVASHLVMAIAQSVVEAMLAALEHAPELESGVALPDVLDVTRAHLHRAHRRPWDDADERACALVAVELTAAPERPPMLALRPPPGIEASRFVAGAVDALFAGIETKTPPRGEA